MIDQNKILELLKQAGLEVEPSEEDFDKPFVEIGLDSLDVFGLFSEIQIALGHSFSDDDFSELKTLNDVLRFLNS